MLFGEELGPVVLNFSGLVLKYVDVELILGLSEVEVMVLKIAIVGL